MRIIKGDLTIGSVKKHYARYFCAAFGSAMIGCIYGSVDSAIVGQYQGPSGIAALSVVMPIAEIIAFVYAIYAMNKKMEN